LIKLIIPGEPVSKARPRVMKGFTYTPAKTVNYETLIKELFIISKQCPLEGPLKAKVSCFFKIPKTGTKAKLQAMRDNSIRPTKKPDTDNLGKICLDALNELAYKDDSQVVELLVSKWYSENPRVEVEIIMLEEANQ
jgi:Holliday junction resolvase RusA-like endonuclease